jgi:hypothetical protein
MFNARQLFRAFGHSSVASKSLSYPCLSSFAEQVRIQTAGISTRTERDRLLGFKAL